MSRIPGHIIGWNEMVGFPGLGIAAMPAKIDTGARTTALHAEMLDRVEGPDGPILKFKVFLDTERKVITTAAPLIDEREVKNTSGVPEKRYIVRTDLQIGGASWPIEVSLSDRANMQFDVIIGRTAIENHGILVDVSTRFRLGHNPAKGHFSKVIKTKDESIK